MPSLLITGIIDIVKGKRRTAVNDVAKKAAAIFSLLENSSNKMTCPGMAKMNAVNPRDVSKFAPKVFARAPKAKKVIISTNPGKAKASFAPIKRYFRFMVDIVF